MEVKGMAFPGKDVPGKLEDFSALQLFVLNARKANVEMIFTESDLLAVSQICRMVEGMPLGIELAAAWVRTLSCQEIAQEMRASLDFLTTSQRGVVERHRSLRAVLSIPGACSAKWNGRFFENWQSFGQASAVKPPRRWREHRWNCWRG